MGSRGVVSVDVLETKPPAEEPRTVTSSASGTCARADDVARKAVRASPAALFFPGFPGLVDRARTADRLAGPGWSAHDFRAASGGRQGKQRGKPGGQAPDVRVAPGAVRLRLR